MDEPSSCHDVTNDNGMRKPNTGKTRSTRVSSCNCKPRVQSSRFFPPVVFVKVIAFQLMTTQHRLWPFPINRVLGFRVSSASVSLANNNSVVITSP